MSILKSKKAHFLVALCLVAAIVFSLIIPGSIGAGAVKVSLFDGSGIWEVSSDNTELLCDDGSAWSINIAGFLPQIATDGDNSFVSAVGEVNQFDYELSYRYKAADAVGASVSGGKYLSMDIKVPVPEELYSAAAGSLHSIKDNKVTSGSWLTAATRALGIYFYDSDNKCLNAGILQSDFRNALKTAYSDKEGNTWVHIVLPITGEFASDDAIKTVYFDFGKNTKSNVDFSVAIDNLCVTDTDKETAQPDDGDDNDDSSGDIVNTGIFREFVRVNDSWKKESTEQLGGVLRIGNDADGIMTPEGFNPDKYNWDVVTDPQSYSTYGSTVIPSNDFDYELYVRKGYAFDANSAISLDGMEYVLLYVRIQNKAALNPSYFSKFVLGEGRVEGGTYDGTKALGIAVSGKSGDNQDESSVYTAGVTQYDLYNALSAVQQNEWSVIALPISGSFDSDDVAKYVFFDFSKGFNEDLKLDISAIEFADTDYVMNRGYISSDIELKLEGAPDFKFNDSTWWPQLVVPAKGFKAGDNSNVVKLNQNYKYVKFDIKIGEIETVIKNLTWGSRSTLGGGELAYNGNDLGIYFEGTNVNGIGIKQSDLFAAIRNYEKTFKEDGIATFHLPIGGEFNADSTITGLNMMLTHPTGDISGSLKDIPIYIDNFVFTTTPPPTVDNGGDDDEGNGGSSDDSPSATNNPDDGRVVLSAGSDYIFSGEAWDAQLFVSSSSENAKPAYKTIKFDLKLGDVAKIVENFKAGSNASIDPEIIAKDGMDYGYASALGLYFDGVNVENIGVTQQDLKAALEANKDAFIKGEAVSLSLPISGVGFKDDSVITGIKMMLTHGNGNLSGINVSLSNIVLSEDFSDGGEEPSGPSNPSGPSEPVNPPSGENNADDGIIIIKDGKDFVFNNNAWEPQLILSTESENALSTYKYLKFDLMLGDVSKIIENLKVGSKSNTSGGEFSYATASDLGIYFSGTDVLGSGITQEDLFKAITSNEAAFKNGETVTLCLPIKGIAFKSTSVITALNMMLTHGDAANNIKDIAVSISNVNLLINNPSASAANNPDDGVFVLTDGKEYSFKADQWYPQLVLPVEEEKITNKDYITLSMDITCTDIAKIIENITISSRMSGDNGEWTDGDNHPLKIYFTGTDVDKIGVDSTAFRNALESYAEDLAAGKTVTIEFDLYNGKLFKETSVITGINIMPTHGSKANNINGVNISIENVKLLKTKSSSADSGTITWENNVIFSGEEGKWQNKGKGSSALGEREVVSLLTWGESGCSVQVIKEGDNTYIKEVSSEHEWNPDFWFKTSNTEYNLKGVGYIRLDIKLENPAVLINTPFFSDASASGAAEYGGGAYYIYFCKDGGRGGLGVGVTQTAFRAAISHFQAKLEQGQWVTIDLPIDDPEALATLEFDQIVFKYGKGLSEPVTVYYDNIKFMTGKSTASYTVAAEKEEAAGNEVVEPGSIKKNKTLTSGDITSTLDNIVIDFENKKIYVAEGSIVRDLHTYIELSSDFSKSIRFEGANMANRSKKIEGESFDYVVIDSDGNETIFRIIPCPLDENGKIIIPASEDDTSADKKGWSINIDWKMLLTVLASVIVGAAIMLLIELIRNKKFVLFKKS